MANKTSTPSPAKNNNKNKSSPASLSYTKNTPMLFIIGIFLFFVMFQLLKTQKYKENALRQKIDAEIRKKLYYTDEYY
jgi:hypothetical protein